MATGSTTINFGSAPGTNFVSASITGQGSIASNSYIEAFLMSEATVDHNDYEHCIVPIRLTCGNIVAGTGFTIFAVTDWRLTGTFNVRWVWV
jgi:hypothetical protein